MFTKTHVTEIGSQYRAWLTAALDPQRSPRVFDWFDLCTYADCPRRFRNLKRSAGAELEIFDRALELAAAHPPGFEATYALPPATVQETVLVCPGCGSASPGHQCSKCGVTRRATRRNRPFSPASAGAKIWKAEMRRANKLPLTPAKAADLRGAAAALHADPAVAAMAQDARPLLCVSGTWSDGPGNGPLDVHAVISLLPKAWSADEGAIVLIGSCVNAHPASFAVKAYRRAIHVRAALALDLAAAAQVGPVNKVLLAYVEASEPYVVARRLLTADALTAGREIYEGALRNLGVSLREGFWPDYDTGGRDELGWSQVDPEDALHNQARALLSPPLTVEPSGRATPLVGLPEAA
jgi:hypothetical protein